MDIGHEIVQFVHWAKLDNIGQRHLSVQVLQLLQWTELDIDNMGRNWTEACEFAIFVMDKTD